MSAIDEDTYLELASRAQDGADLLDATDPDWYWFVNPETLAMNGVDGIDGKCGCVVIQLNPARRYQPRVLGVLPGEAGMFGFISFFGDRYPVLDEVWRDLINERRAEWFDKHERRAS